MPKWIQLEAGFYRHPKTLRLKRVIGTDALWVPSRLWCYCSERESDDVSGLSAEDLKDILEYAGDAVTLFDALKSSGYLSQDGKTVVGWADRYGAKFQFFRDRAKQGAAARWGKAAISDPQKENTEIRLDKIKKHPEASVKDASSMLEASVVVPIEAAASLLLSDEPFKAAWADWLQHRREIKRPVTPTSEKHTLKRCEAWGPDRAIAAIRFTISMGWQGLKEPDEGSGGRSMTRNGSHVGAGASTEVDVDKLNRTRA